VTLHLPASEWYAHTERNPSWHWPLDYPPLTALHSRLCALLLHHLEPEAVALASSRGYESALSKLAIRCAVLLSDASFLLPAVAFACVAAPLPPNARPPQRLLALALASLFPPQALIDHGHTQFNCVSLGLSLSAACLTLNSRLLFASAAFTLAFNHKHMALYFAPAFFSHMLGCCLQKGRLARSWRASVSEVCALASTVLSATLLCWLPLLVHGPGVALQALSQVLPLHRGVFEDYVSNFWCISNTVFDWERRFQPSTLAGGSALVTLLCVAPSCALEVIRPTKRGFTRLLFICSLSAFLFGYQVHEKNILYPCTAALLLCAESPLLYAHFVLVATFSMVPLLEKDGLMSACIALIGLMLSTLGVCGMLLDKELMRPFSLHSNMRGRLRLQAVLRTARTMYGSGLVAASCAGCLLLLLLRKLARPPAALPFFHDLAISAFSFAHFVAFLSLVAIEHFLLVEKRKEE